MKKIFIFAGHVLPAGTASLLADAYEKGARSAGYEIRRMNLWDMKFDPVMHQDYHEIQELEPDLVKFQDAVKWADHIVFTYPNWWSAMPAKFKGIFDRAFLPGFAFNFDKVEKKRLIKKLKGRSARVITTNGQLHPILVRMIVGDTSNEIKRGILKFCGVSPVRMSSFGPSDGVSKEKLEKWMSKVERLGSNAK